MNRPARLFAFALAGSAFAAIACGSGDDTTAPAPVVDAGSPDATKVDAAATVREASVAVAAVAYVRIADFSSDAPALDFCLAPAGSGAFHGPLLSTTFTVPSDSSVLGIAFEQVSSYMAAPTGPFDVRFVAAGSVDCSAPAGADYSGWALAANSYSTFAALGFASVMPTATNALRVAPMADDRTVASGGAAVRFIDAYENNDRDGVIFGSLGFGPLFQNMQFPQVSAPKDTAMAALPVDSNGYMTLTSFPTDVMTVSTLDEADGGLPLAEFGPVGLAAGAIVTFVFVPPVPGSDASVTGQLLECVDNAGTVGPLGNCTATP
jgi:hypothetical protein